MCVWTEVETKEKKEEKKRRNHPSPSKMDGEYVSDLP